MDSDSNNAKIPDRSGICYTTDTHAYYIDEAKLERQKLEIPTDKSQQEEFFKKHADRVEERIKFTDVVEEGPTPVAVLQEWIRRGVQKWNEKAIQNEKR
jgi:hypothetical protein